MLSFQDTMKLMKKYKIPVPKHKLVKNIKDAVDSAEKIGYPVVMKVYSLKIIHKTEVDGIRTNVKGKKEVKENFKKLMKISESVLIQKQVDGLETIVGGLIDSQFGPCISFGTGGIMVEALKDVKFRVCPISRKDAMEMIEETKIYNVLKGFRGKKYDIKSVIDILMKVSKIMTKEKIKELDINPLICSEKGSWAVDVRAFL